MPPRLEPYFVSHPPHRSAPLLVPLYASGAVVVAWAVADLLRAGAAGQASAVLLLAAAAVLAELFPVPTSLDDEGIKTTYAITFTFALLLYAGPAPAIVAATVASIVADLMARRAWWKVAFNASHNPLSLAAAAVVLAAVGDLPRAGGALPFTTARDLVATGLAAFACYATNTVVVTGLLAGIERRPVRSMLGSIEDLNLEALLLIAGLAPIVVVVADRPPLLPALALPLAFIHRIGTQAVERQHRATHDELTGLANRQLLLRRAAVAIDDGHELLLVAIGLDGLATVNQAFGHQMADGVVQEAGERLLAAFPDPAVVTRIGDTELAVLVIDGVDDRFVIAEQVRSALGDSFHCGSLAVDMATSIGSAVHPADAEDADLLLRRAQVAVQRARELGAGIATYHLDDDAEALRRLALVSRLRRAAAGGELLLHYQPKVRISDSVVVGVEALLRWQHPVRGLLGPSAFVPLIEQTDLATVITEFVIDEATDQCKAWREIGLDLRVSVNVPARALRGDGLVTHVQSALSRNDLPASRLLVELTEHGIVEELDDARRTLGSLRALGVEVAVDDFGTGLASLTYLHHLPVDELKVDKSFVAGMGEEPRLDAIVASTIELGHRLGLRVVAEGVERVDDLVRIRSLGCDQAQGFLLCRPVPAEDLALWAMGPVVTLKL